MDKADVAGLWAVELHRLGGMKAVQVKDLVELNRMIAVDPDREPDRMTVAVCRTFDEARVSELEIKRERRAARKGAHEVAGA